jgi:hypothetical protein
MKREDCWMSFSQALNQYMEATRDMSHFGYGGRNWQEASERKIEAEEHMDALTNSNEFRGG